MEATSITQTNVIYLSTISNPSAVLFGLTPHSRATDALTLDSGDLFSDQLSVVQ